MDIYISACMYVACDGLKTFMIVFAKVKVIHINLKRKERNKKSNLILLHITRQIQSQLVN